MQKFPEMRERSHDIRLPHALHPWPPTSTLKTLEPLPLSSELPPHLVRLGDHDLEVRGIRLVEAVGEPLELLIKRARIRVLVTEPHVGDAQGVPRSRCGAGLKDFNRLVAKPPFEVRGHSRGRGSVDLGHDGRAGQFRPEPGLRLEVGAGQLKKGPGNQNRRRAGRAPRAQGTQARNRNVANSTTCTAPCIIDVRPVPSVTVLTSNAVISSTISFGSSPRTSGRP